MIIVFSLSFFLPPLYQTGDITYTFMFGSPGSDFYFAARINPNNPLYVDMRIEGTANGWVGVGFTPNRTMVSLLNNCSKIH